MVREAVIAATSPTCILHPNSSTAVYLRFLLGASDQHQCASIARSLRGGVGGCKRVFDMSLDDKELRLLNLKNEAINSSS
jgi:hypothetical protein